MPLNVHAKYEQKPSNRLGDTARTNGRTVSWKVLNDPKVGHIE